MDSDDAKLPSRIEETLKKASEEILNNSSGSFFTIREDESEKTNYYSAYNSNDLAEYVNFDVIEEEDDNLEAFNNLTTNSNYEDITGDRKVLKLLVDPGIGQVVPVNSIVLIHYVAYVSNFHEPFDVTYLQSKRPKRFTLGIGEILPGLEIGIKTMTMGENAKFIVKPELAYRELGCPPRIPPNATILFDVHLISYLSPENCLSFDEENQDPENFTKTFTRVKKLHIEGNEQFKLKNFEKAISKYVIAKELLHLVRSNSDYEEIEIMKYLSKIYINLSVCYIKQCAFTKVCRMGLEAMKYSERFSKHSAKLYFNWGKALRLLKNFREAKIKLQKSLKLEPYNETIQNEMAKLEKDKKFNYNIEMFTLNDNSNTDNENLPPDFWEVFNTHLIEFIDSTDDILTVTVNNQDDIEIVKRKASSYGLLTHVITKADKSTNCIAIQKTEE